MTFEEMFESAKKSLMKAKVADKASHIAVQINVTGEGSGIFYAEANEGKLSVEPYDYNDNHAVMTVDSAVLLDALKKADTSALTIEGDPEKVAAFRAILETLPKPRKTAAKTAAKKEAAPKKAETKTTASKTTAKKEAAPKKAETKTAAKTTAKKVEEEKKPAAAKTTAAKKEPAAKKETAAAAKKTETKKTETKTAAKTASKTTKK